MTKEVKAQAVNIGNSPRKTRMVADSIRGQNAMYAMDMLKYMRKGAAPVVRKVLQSAIANAVHNENMEAERLVVTRVMVDGGAVYKRFRAQSKGRARRILKRNSHITVYVSDPAVQAVAEAKAEKPVAVETKAEAKKEAGSRKQGDTKKKTTAKPKAKTKKTDK